MTKQKTPDDGFFGPEKGSVLSGAPEDADIDVGLLSPDEQRAMRKKAEALRKLLGESKLAKYKIEVMFDNRKTTRGAFPGGVVIWRSGSVLSGGGDEILYPCPDDLCTGLIGSENIAPISKSCYCDKCKRVWKQSDLKEIRLYYLDPAKWSLVLARTFLRLGCQADIYMKWAGDERIQDRARAEQARNRGGEELYAARRARKEPVMYELHKLIKDVNAGASIEARMRALITG